MAPIYKKKMGLGGVLLEPEQPYTPPTPPRVILTEAEIKAIEEDAHHPIQMPVSPSVAKPKPLLRYRDILQLSMQNVADLFAATVTGVVTIPILGDPSVTEAQITQLKARIRELEELLSTRTRMWQKFHRPDDMLSPADLQRLRQQEQRELENLQTQVRRLQKRLRNWGNDKDDYVGTETKLIDMLFEEKYPNIVLNEATPAYGTYPFKVTKRVRNAAGGYDVVEEVEQYSDGVIERTFDKRYNIRNYRELLTLGSLAPLTDGMTWENWSRWENAAILVAITEGIIKPDLDLISYHPRLGRWFVPLGEDAHAEVGDEERKLILKTGGGALGGATIYSRGWRYGTRGGWTRRALESFDATARIRKPDADVAPFNDAGPSFSHFSHADDDTESVDPR